MAVFHQLLLAVLPLENLSGDPAQDYFADGMTDELITDLGQISSLRVISRTSSMRFKGVRKPLPQIARELNVDAVVEGAVVRSGNQLRITAQLIHGPTDEHLWAQSYEGDVRDVLGLQNQVASAIARQIRIQLTPQQQAVLKSARVVNPEAYDDYLKALSQKGTVNGLQKSIAYLQQASKELDHKRIVFNILSCLSSFPLCPGHRPGSTLLRNSLTTQKRMRESAATT